ncbi:AMP-binding protein [Nocardia alni]|uniref:AMP-binding protein n=1 Tax=Nocardia alni TaxID=2815723 RepID=UPI001C21623B|nr:AMP-binding protein [Nocardia alni]
MNTAEPPTTLRVFRENSRRYPDRPQLIYFDTILTVRQVDELSDALAAALAAEGVGPGDRVAAFMQNMPHYVLTLLAVWKLGAILVPVNPMLRAAELEHHLNDCGAVVLVALDTLWRDVARDVVAATAVRRVITARGCGMQTRNDERVLADRTVEPATGVLEFETLLARYRGRAPRPHEPSPEDVAFLCYTSGTTGAPKGAMCSHRNVISVGRATCAVTAVGPHSTVLALAPLFHITGLMVQLVPALISCCPLVLSFRFHPGVMLDSIREHRPTFAVGPVTAYIGLLQNPGFTLSDFAAFDRVYSGGAPISPATARSFEERTGQQLLGAYGMTEATAATHLTPKGMRSPVDPTTGALAVGLPTPGTSVRIVDDDGNELPAGTAGEVVLSSPGVVSGYWNRPDATAATIRDGLLYSGDIGVVDEDGWLFLVDRKKDLINCSGFKVWPREVEDALYEHPAVLEAAVVGAPDRYRGETVKAFVSLKKPGSVDSAELAAFVRERLAAYKRPSEIQILGSLPKTSSGKILRRALRDSTTSLPTAALD